MNEKNEKQMLHLLEPGPRDRDSLVVATGLPRTTIYDVLARLMKNGDVIRYPVRDGKRGRPRVMFRLIGELEHEVMHVLRANGALTTTEIADLVNIPLERAKGMLHVFGANGWVTSSRYKHERIWERVEGDE